MLVLGLMSALGIAHNSGAVAQQAMPTIVLNVAADGDDANDAVSQPVRSIARALAIAREKRASAVQKVRIEVAISGGTYQVDAPIVLSEADSGLPEAPLVIRARSSDPALLAGGP